MGADEKHAATYHGGEYTPSELAMITAWCDQRRNLLEYNNQPPEGIVERTEQAQRTLAKVRAEAKAEALEQYHADVLYIDRVIECKADPDDRWYDFVESENEWRTEEKQGGRRMFNENAATYYAKYRANQYKENQ